MKLKESRAGHFLTKDTVSGGTQIVYYEPSSAWNVASKYKTVARLDRGRPFPIVSAASGWRTDYDFDATTKQHTEHTEHTERVLDNRVWRDRVMELCQLIEYALPGDSRDESRRPGSYYASHAEKKLVAYYIGEHAVLPGELFSEPEDGTWVHQDLRLQHLAAMCPAVPTVPTSIQVSRAICMDCRDFIAHVKTVLGISFTVEHC